MELAAHFTQTKNRDLLKDFFIVVGTSILFAMAAWISIPLFFTPIKISFTCQLVLLASVYLGKRGTYATLLYLSQGIMGLPVFASGGAGIAYLMGPSGGYLVGFAIASYVVACLSEQLEEKTSLKTFAIMALGNALIYVFGLTHLAMIVGGQNALKLGFYPFLGIDLLKLLVANRMLKKLS